MVKEILTIAHLIGPSPGIENQLIFQLAPLQVEAVEVIHILQMMKMQQKSLQVIANGVVIAEEI